VLDLPGARWGPASRWGSPVQEGCRPGGRHAGTSPRLRLRRGRVGWFPLPDDDVGVLAEADGATMGYEVQYEWWHDLRQRISAPISSDGRCPGSSGGRTEPSYLSAAPPARTFRGTAVP